jgi:DNA-binding winged helix-turn-helix (wHTH) protein
MIQKLIEQEYPLNFRKDESKELGKHLKYRHSVVLVGMKKVGIGNFLKYFINNKDIPGTYIKDYKKHLFISIDLNDLVECEIAPFWTLTLKRIVDAVENSVLSDDIKKQTNAMFLESIQLQNLFFTIECVSTALKRISESGFVPTLFFLRFDRMKNAASSEFFANLEGIKSTNQQVSFVFTSSLPFSKLIPSVLPKTSWGVFLHDIYIKPAKKEDIKIIYSAYRKKFLVFLTKDLEEFLFETVNGYTQFLQLALIYLHERDKPVKNKDELIQGLENDERMLLQSEELWENLDKNEKEILIKIIDGKKLRKPDIKKGEYLWNTGMVIKSPDKFQIFSKLFVIYVMTRQLDRKRNETGNELSRKENLLFKLLLENKGVICEREKIIEQVWPEEENLGVSDWAIDKLVARVRNKLNKTDNNFEIQTIKTRGYKLSETH